MSYVTRKGNRWLAVIALGGVSFWIAGSSCSLAVNPDRSLIPTPKDAGSDASADAGGAGGTAGGGGAGGSGGAAGAAGTGGAIGGGGMGGAIGSGGAGQSGAGGGR